MIISLTGAGCVGPMTQNEFLHKMGIRQRMQVGRIELYCWV